MASPRLRRKRRSARLAAAGRLPVQEQPQAEEAPAEVEAVEEAPAEVEAVEEAPKRAHKSSSKKKSSAKKNN